LSGSLLKAPGFAEGILTGDFTLAGRRSNETVSVARRVVILTDDLSCRVDREDPSIGKGEVYRRIHAASQEEAVEAAAPMVQSHDVAAIVDSFSHGQVRSWRIERRKARAILARREAQKAMKFATVDVSAYYLSPIIDPKRARPKKRIVVRHVERSEVARLPDESMTLVVAAGSVGPHNLTLRVNKAALR